MHALGVVGGRVQGRGPARLAGVVEAVLAGGQGGAAAVATEDDGAAAEAEAGAHPAGVQREAERHQTLLLIGGHREPDGGHRPAGRWGGGGGVGNGLDLNMLTSSTLKYVTLLRLVRVIL